MNTEKNKWRKKRYINKYEENLVGEILERSLSLVEILDSKESKLMLKKLMKLQTNQKDF